MDWNRPLEPGPVLDNPGASALKARVVRDALRSLANDPSAGWMFEALAGQASDGALIQLGRLLKG